MLLQSRSLVRSMSEILFLCGRNDKAVIASLNILDGDLLESVEGSKDEVSFVSLVMITYPSTY